MTAPGRHRRPELARLRIGEAGSATVEFVLLTPVFLALLLFIVGLGRIAESQGQVNGAARDAARAASQQRTPPAAVQAARQAARDDLLLAGVTCRSLTVTTDTSGFRAGGQVQVTVDCTADLSDLLGTGLPARKSMRSVATAPLERYRSVQP